MILELLRKSQASPSSPFYSETGRNTGIAGIVLENTGRARAQWGSLWGNLGVFRESLFAKKLLRIGKAQIML